MLPIVPILFTQPFCPQTIHNPNGMGKEILIFGILLVSAAQALNDCPPGYIWDDCKICENNCDGIKVYTRMCLSGCTCPEDSIEINGTCLLLSAYCPSKAPVDQFWSECQIGSGTSCSFINSRCSKGYFCKNPELINVEGECVNKEEYCAKQKPMISSADFNV